MGRGIRICSVVVGLTLLAGCSGRTETYRGTITLYGEVHGVSAVLEKELALWQDHYRKGARHLFVELPYYTAEFLNQWMHEGDDRILEALYSDLEGTAAHRPATLVFYRGIKATCPETIFHGTDVGHQYASTGERFLQTLRDRNQQNTREYQTAQEVVAQGRRYYQGNDEVYRESAMTADFERELARVGNADVVGFYGAAHTDANGLNFTHEVPSMAHQLRQAHGDRVQTVDLSPWALVRAPLRTDTLTVGHRTYQAGYYGKQDMSWSRDFVYREFWILADAYTDFQNAHRTGEVLPYNNYPMEVPLHQVFLVRYTRADGTSKTVYYLSDGKVWEGMDSTEAVEGVAQG